MSIEIKEYLTEEEMKQIAIDAFKSECEKRFNGDFERIISNSAYSVVWEQMDNLCDNDVVETLKDRVVSIISELTPFNVFKEPNAWGIGTNKPYEILVSCVKENKDQLNGKVKSAINQVSNKEMRPLMLKVLEKAIG